MTPHTPLEISEETSGLIGLPELVNERDQLKLRVEELESQNKTFRAAQKACETCDTTEFESLQKQIVGLREALDIQNRASHAIVSRSPNALRLAGLSDKYYQQAINETTNFSHLYVRREVLEKCRLAIELLYDPTCGAADYQEFTHFLTGYSFGTNSKIDRDLKEALTFARKELGK